MDEQSKPTFEGQKWTKFGENIQKSWVKANSQRENIGHDMPVDHYFPTQLAVILMKLEFHERGNENTALTLTKEEGRHAVHEVLNLLVREQVDTDQLKRVMEIWNTDKSEDRREMTGYDIAELLGDDNTLWDPFRSIPEFKNLRKSD